MCVCVCVCLGGGGAGDSYVVVVLFGVRHKAANSASAFLGGERQLSAVNISQCEANVQTSSNSSTGTLSAGELVLIIIVRVCVFACMCVCASLSLREAGWLCQDFWQFSPCRWTQACIVVALGISFAGSWLLQRSVEIRARREAQARCVLLPLARERSRERGGSTH